MGIPTVSAMLTPLLKLCGDKKEHSIQEAIEHLSRLFRLSTDDTRKLLPSGGSSVFDNRVAWVQTNLKHSGLIESARRGYFRITDRGVGVLSQNVTIDLAFLKQFPEYLEFIRPRGEKIRVEKSTSMDDTATDSGSYDTSPLDKDKAPEEIFDDTYEAITETLVNEVLEKVKGYTSIFFERMVVQLLVKMGYGGSIKEAGRVIGKSGDEGIDGMIKEDILGLDVIHVQAKKWDGVVGRPEVFINL